jgi:hypothetical protein
MPDIAQGKKSVVSTPDVTVRAAFALQLCAWV